MQNAKVVEAHSDRRESAGRDVGRTKCKLSKFFFFLFFLKLISGP